MEPTADDVDGGGSGNGKEVDPHLATYAASRKTIPHWLAQPHWRANASAKPKVAKADEPVKLQVSKGGALSMAGTGSSKSGKPHGGSGESTITPDQSDNIAPVQEVVASALNKADHATFDKGEQFKASLATADMAVDAGDVAGKSYFPLLSPIRIIHLLSATVILDATRPASASGSAPLSSTASRILDPFDDLVPRSAPAAGRDGLAESGSSISKRTRDTRTPELTDAGDGAKRPKREDVPVKPPLPVALA